MDSNVSAASELQQKYQHFRILVIGRANAGKTTLLKRVCNTTEEPCIWDEEKRNLLEPTADRGIHDIYRPFAFSSNPQFIFHDSPGFEKGGVKELEDVQQFIEERAKATNVEDQLHAVWFCLVTHAARPLLELEERFFKEKRFGNVPVIAIFTKYDDLVTQLYDEDKEDDEICQDAAGYVEDKFRKPLAECDYPPSAYLCLEDMQQDDGNHQQQVKKLMEKTADSLGDPALKLLFVSIQQNNLELCMRYAVQYTKLENFGLNGRVLEGLQWFRHAYYESYNYGKTEDVVGGGERLGGVEEGGGRFFGVFFFERLYNNVVTAEKIMDDSPSFQSLESFAALLICAEQSFWIMSGCGSTSFDAAFRAAWKMLTEDQQQAANLCSALGRLLRRGEDSNEFKMNKWKQEFLNIILQHRLLHEHRQ